MGYSGLVCAAIGGMKGRVLLGYSGVVCAGMGGRELPGISGIACVVGGMFRKVLLQKPEVSVDVYGVSIMHILRELRFSANL